MTYKSLRSKFATCLLASSFLLFSGCANDDWFDSETGEEATISFTPAINLGLDTRAISDGTGIDELVVVVVDEKGRPFHRQNIEWETAKKGVELRYFKGHSYNVLFWAQNSANTAYDIADNGFISVDYTDHAEGGFSEMEKMDAFYSTFELNGMSKSAGNAVSLTRAMAQINLGSDEVKPVVGEHRAEVKISNLPTTLNPFANKEAQVGGIEADKVYSFTFTDFPDAADDNLSANGIEYSYVATCYVLAPAKLSVEYSLYPADGDDPIITKSFEDLPVEPNNRTNIVGNIVEEPLEMDTWDGSISVNAPAKQGNKYLIKCAADLAWLADYGNTLESGSTFELKCDLDMNNLSLKSVKLPVNSTFEGKNHYITNLNLTTGGLFGDATTLTVKDLDITIAAMSATSKYVGALVNTLTGNGNFSNINVAGKKVTIAGTGVGGYVGYAKSTADGTASSVTFTNCKVSSLTLDGSAVEGKFIGLFRGYKDNETLSFTNCSVEGLETKYASYYIEGNEACWLQANNYSTYNGWLGKEELYRGHISFDNARFVPRWDGSTKITPLKDGTTSLIYSAFDLANMQGQSSVYMKFINDIDLGGFRNPANNGTLVTRRNQFIPINSATYVDGNTKTVYNLYTEDNKTPFYGAAFIRLLAGSTVKNLTISNAIVLGHPNDVDFDDHKAYGGILSGYVTGTNTIENVHVKDSYISAVGKLGGFIGTCQGGNTTINNCSVSGCTINNFKVDVKENFSAAGGLVSCDFTQNGEVGGFIGFISSTVTTISNCKVENTTIDCYGEADQTALVVVRVPGRHINRFIGDYRTLTADVKLYLNNCSATGCTVKNESQAYYKSGTKKNYIETIGSAYYIYAMVNLGFKKYEVGSDRKGTLYIDGVDRSSALKSVKATDY